MTYLVTVGGWPNMIRQCLWSLFLLCTVQGSAVAAEPHVTAAVLADFPPLYQQTHDGKPEGFAIDILNHISQQAGLQVDYLPVKNWAEAMQAVREGRADLVPGIGISQTREQEFIFSEEIEVVPVSWFVRTDSRTITSEADLKQHNIAVLKESAAATRLARDGHYHLVPYDTLESALFGLLSGHVDAFVFPQPVLLKKAREVGVEEKVRALERPLMELKRGYLYRTDNLALHDRLDPLILQFVKSPEYQELYLKWYGSPRPFWTLQHLFYAMLSLALAVVLVIFLYRYNYVYGLIRRLKASEERFELAMRASNDGLWDWNMQANTVYFSPGWKAMLGYADEELENAFSVWEQLVDEAGRESTLSAIQKCVEGRADGFIMEFRMRHKDGHWVDILSRATIIRDSSGNPQRMVGTHVDISERKRAAESLARSKKSLAEAQRLSNLGSWELEINSNTLKWSDEIYRIFEIDKSSFGASYDAFLNAIHPDDRDKVNSVYLNSLQTRQPYSIRHRLLMSDGRIKYVHEECQMEFDENGEAIRSLGTVQDVTEQMLFEKQLEESKQLLQAVIDNVPMRIFWKDRALNYIGCNPAFAQDAGMSSPREMIGKDDFQMAWANEADMYRADDLGVIESGMAKINFEESQTTPDGKTIWLRTSKVPLLSKNKDVIGVLGLYDDITDSKMMEKSLRDSEGRFRRVFELSPDATWMMEGHHFVAANQAAVTLFGFDGQDDFIHVHPSDISPQYQPDGEDSMSKAERMMKVADSEGINRFEWLHKRVDGSEFFAEVTLSAIILNNEKALVAVVRDISERKKHEAELWASKGRLEAAASAGIVGIWDWDVLSDSLSWDKVMYQLYGLNDGEFGGNHEAWLNIVHPDDRNRAESDIDAALMGESEYCSEFRVVWRDGVIRHIKAMARVNFNEQGTPVRMIGVNYDITEQKSIQLTLDRQVAERTHELESAKEMAEAANLAKSAFLANMSHEIRTPLNAISGMAYLMRRQGVSPGQARNLDKINVAAQHLLETINAILSLSKIEAGQFALEESEFSIASVIGNLRSMVQHQLDSKGLSFKVQMELLPNRMIGDPTRLQQALLNYVANAVKFTEHGSITLRVHSLEKGENDMLLRFEVEDTGMGISPEVLPKLFNPFEQADNTITRKFGGTGLGLTITRKFAQLMGGDAGVNSTLGVGSTFWFTCRLRKGNSAVAGTIEGPEDIASTLRQNYTGSHILLVEDEEINREIARYILEELLFVVDEAANGEDAVRMATERDYDLILMDMQMPVMDGLEATRQIRQQEQRADVPIIAMTANAFEEDRFQCLEAGMNDFLSKPVDPEQLYSALLRWLHSRLSS